MPVELSHKPVPPRALALSLAALAVPVVSALRPTTTLGEQGALLWLLALVPAFLLAYYRGWRGVATALAAGMATLSLTQAVALWTGRSIPDILPGVVVAYVAIALAVGWLSDAFRREGAEVRDMAFTDLLTRLPNRRHARLFLENEFAAAERGRDLAVVLFDLDRFKEYNDRHGHAAGDEALRAFGLILAETTRRMDLSARFGGEEFVSVLTGTDREGAFVFAERIRSALSAYETPDGSPLAVSGGVAAYHPSFRSPDELLAAADHALYEAKREGRDRIHLYGDLVLDHAMPSQDSADALLERLRTEPADYPRAAADIGRTPPSLTLLPHQITGFGAGRHVLLVEDDAQVRSLVSGYLAREGFRVTEAATVPAAIQCLGSDFDAVVTDLRLPGASGTELVSAIKSRWPLTQVLAVTGLHDPAVAAGAIAAGATVCLFKPFGMPELGRQLSAALERRDRLRSDRARRTAPSEGAGPGEDARALVLRAAETLLAAGEVHEPYTAGHADRVAAAALHIADALDPEGTRLDREALRLGCRLRDLGRLGVERSVLARPGPLVAEELARVREHPTFGRCLLEAVLRDEEILEVVAWHHERWDGEGYPDRLAGPAIPLAARAAAVADALEAMCAPRPHRPARSWEEAVAELKTHAGRQFDPDVIAATAACLDELRALFDRSRA